MCIAFNRVFQNKSHHSEKHRIAFLVVSLTAHPATLSCNPLLGHDSLGNTEISHFSCPPPSHPLCPFGLLLTRIVRTIFCKGDSITPHQWLRGMQWPGLQLSNASIGHNRYYRSIYFCGNHDAYYIKFWGLYILLVWVKWANVPMLHLCDSTLLWPRN